MNFLCVFFNFFTVDIHCTLLLLQDLDSDAVTMIFTVNGETQGVAFSINRSELQDKALFPHILSKNTKFRCNFGNEDSWFPPPDGYTFVSHIAADQRVSGPKRPEKREECEVRSVFHLKIIVFFSLLAVIDNVYFNSLLQIIMMCGLPGCGKTTWANEYYAKHLDKKYNILGTNNLIDKMKVSIFPH